MPRLCLSRREGKTIQIGKDIYVHVDELTHGQVRLSIQAPIDVPIIRTELKVPKRREIPAASR